MKHARDKLYMASNGIVQPIGPETDEEWAIFISLVRDEYDRLHPDDTFDDLKRRARLRIADQARRSVAEHGPGQFADRRATRHRKESRGQQACAVSVPKSHVCTVCACNP